MSKTYRKLFNAFGLLVVFIALKACMAPEDNAVGAATTEPETPAESATQTLLLTQAFDFGVTDKNRVDGQYQNRNKITVPNDKALVKIQ